METITNILEANKDTNIQFIDVSANRHMFVDHPGETIEIEIINVLYSPLENILVDYNYDEENDIVNIDSFTTPPLPVSPNNQIYLTVKYGGMEIEWFNIQLIDKQNDTPQILSRT